MGHRYTDLGFVTGPDSTVNRTKQQWSVGATDLGIMWGTGRGEVAVLFGDTYGTRTVEVGAGGTDWRHNVLAFSSAQDLDGGLRLERFVTDEPGHASQVIPDNTFDGFPVEETTIPTGGCCIGGRQYVTYMSVHHWGVPGEWRTNYAGFAYSDDGGKTWVKDPHAWWPNTPDGDQPFQMCALVPHDDGFLYVFGTRNGRRGPACLARVPQDAVLDLSAHEQWHGPVLGWGQDASLALPVVPAPVSELSVMWHEPSGQWLMLYLLDTQDRIVLRRSESVVGPWSEPETLVAEGEYAEPYGAFWHPWSMREPDPSFVLSLWRPYNVKLLRAELDTSGGWWCVDSGSITVSATARGSVTAGKG